MQQEFSRSRAAAFSLLLFVAVLLGAHHVAARVAFDHGAGIASVIVARSVTTAVAVGVLVLLHRVSWTMNRRQWTVMALAGLLIWLQSTLVYSATARIPVALALLSFNTYPIWTALFVWTIYRRRPDKAFMMMMPLIVLGLTLALNVRAAIGDVGVQAEWSGVGVGVVSALGAAAIYGLVLSLMQYEAAGVDGRLRTLLTMTVVGVLSVSISGFNQDLQWPVDSVGWWSIGFLVVCFGAGFTIMFSLLPKLGVVSNSPILSVEPVAVLVLAWVVLGQTIDALQVIGSLIVVAAVMTLGLMRGR